MLAGYWCPPCAGTPTKPTPQRQASKYRLTDLHAKAAEHGGKCLSSTYHGTNAPYRLRCAAGHEWDALENNILHGGWCRPCRNEGQKLGIEAMRALASERGGICPYDVYLHGNRNSNGNAIVPTFGTRRPLE